MPRIPYDVQRDLNFYRTVVAFRNAIERWQIVRGTIEDPDQVALWWGFGYVGRRPHEGGAGGYDRPDDFGPRDDDDLAGSRVPRRPLGGAGAAGAEADVESEDEVDDPVVRRIPA